jgi:hypothetical protein
MVIFISLFASSKSLGRAASEARPGQACIRGW